MATHTRKSAAKSRKLSAESNSIVVYIHGIGKQPPKDRLKLDWDLALFGRDLRARSRMAYWSDILHPASEPEPTIGTLGTVAALDTAKLLRAAHIDRRKDKAREFADALAAHLGAPAQAVGALGKRILPLPGPARRYLSRKFLEAFIKDTAAYFFRPDVRHQCRARLSAALPPRGTPFTLVAHSQGTVIAYEVLSGIATAALTLEELVTLGSPLGIREVQDFLEPPELNVPPPVERWHNFADVIDPVAFDKALATDFNPSGFVTDALIVNSTIVQDLNPHSAVGYLAHPKVRKTVHDAMRMDTMARFVVARDVAETLAATPDSRHSVLVELLEPGYPALGEEDAPEPVRRRLRAEPGTVAIADRIEAAARGLEGFVSDPEAARIDRLQRFVAARLTRDELRELAFRHQEMRVYAVWRSSRKAKLLDRSLRVLKADAAYTSFGAGGRGITWAVLDTGVRGNHPHFGTATIKSVWDCTVQGPPRQVPVAQSRDRDGHGTHVCGIVAGRSGRDDKLRGVAPDAQLVVYKVLDNQGVGEDAWIIKALDHIAQTNENHLGDGLAIHGLNLSLGGPFDSTVYGCGFSPICQELRRQWRAGVLVVVACGNEGLIAVDTPDGGLDLFTQMSIGDPANLEDCIAVGSVHSDRPNLYGVSSFSSRGPTADGRVKPDVIAPGERILSCNAHFRNEKTRYYHESGTSMAAPHVSGLLAAFLSVRREYRGRPDEVKKILLDACTDIGRDRYHQGRGVPNLMQMLLSV